MYCEVPVKWPPFRSLLCARRIPGRSSSSAHRPSGCRGQCPLPADRPLRRRSSRKSSTSRFCIRQLVSLLLTLRPFNQVKCKVGYLNLPAVQNQTSPLDSHFRRADPVGAIGIQADLASFAAMGCHGLSVITAILIGDTARVEDAQVIDADWVADQARVVLEDMPVAAFKVGVVGSVENVSGDRRNRVRLSRHSAGARPFRFSDAGPGPDSEDSDRDPRTLVPQTTLLLCPRVELARLAETWREPSLEDDGRGRCDATDRDRLRIRVRHRHAGGDVHDVANTLFDESGGVLRQDSWQRLPGPFSGRRQHVVGHHRGDAGQRLDVPEAVRKRRNSLMAALANAQRLGMGKLMPDRLFLGARVRARFRHRTITH